MQLVFFRSSKKKKTHQKERGVATKNNSDGSWTHGYAD